MQIMYHRCCGIDVHKKMIVACLLIITAEGVQKEIQTESHGALGSLPAPRVAQSPALRGSGHGKYRSLLEVHLERAGRRDGASAVQRPTYQGGPREENGYQGRRMDRRLAPTRSAASQLCACPSPTGTAGFDPLPQQFGC